jgi:hypothetical protein
MLRMDPHKRLPCDKIAAQLEQIATDCDNDITYCTKRIREVCPRPTGLSEFTVRYSLQPEDPINAVTAINVPQLVTPQPHTLSPILSRESSEVQSETTPLLQRANSKANTVSDKPRRNGFSANICKSTTRWVLEIIKACCCLSGDDYQ